MRQFEGDEREPESRELGQEGAFLRDPVGEDHIVCGYPVCCHEEKCGGVEFEDFADFAACDLLETV